MADKEFAWIYNSKQGIFYIENGLVPIDFGTGTKGDAFMQFRNNEEYKVLFKEWCERQRKKRESNDFKGVI